MPPNDPRPGEMWRQKPGYNHWVTRTVMKRTRSTVHIPSGWMYLRKFIEVFKFVSGAPND